MSDELKYMVEFKVPDPLPGYMYDLVREQLAVADELFSTGDLIMYTLSMDRTKLWVMLQATTESELIHLLDKFPLTAYLEYDYKGIMFHDTLQFMPETSLN